MAKIGVYILKATRYYVGSTSVLDRRLAQYRAGQTHTTTRIGAWELCRFFACASMDEARKFEIRIKASKNITRWIERPRNILSVRGWPQVRRARNEGAGSCQDTNSDPILNSKRTEASIETLSERSKQAVSTL